RDAIAHHGRFGRGNRGTNRRRKTEDQRPGHGHPSRLRHGCALYVSRFRRARRGSALPGDSRSGTGARRTGPLNSSLQLSRIEPAHHSVLAFGPFPSSCALWDTSKGDLGTPQAPSILWIPGDFPAPREVKWILHFNGTRLTA